MNTEPSTAGGANFADDAGRRDKTEKSAGGAGPAARDAWWNRGWIPALLLIAITLLAYQPVWRAGFVWDDDVMLTGNRHVQAPDGLGAIWFSTDLPDYFPMTSTALWLQWRMWGANPLGYHLVNVLLHAFAAVLWWRVLRRLAIPGAWLAAAVFALHPVNVESVAWITEIKNTLAMAFYVTALLAYLRFEDSDSKLWYAVSLGAFLLGLLSKTAIAPLPLVLLGLAWWRRGRIGLREVWRSVPFFAAAALLALVTIWFQQHRAIGGSFIRDDDFWARLAGAGWAAWFYLSKAIFPANLIFVYPRWQIDGANVLSHVPTLLAVAGLAACWRFRARWGKPCLLGFGYFVVLLLPVLGFVTISYMRHSFVADRWQYFALIGPIALTVAGLAAGFGRIATGARFLLPALSTALLLVLGALTWRQSRMYTDLDTLWQTTVARNPNCAVAQNEVGTGLLHQGREAEAIARYQKALEIMPGYGLAHHNYGCALLKLGRVDEAIGRFQQALMHHKGFYPAEHYLGVAFLQRGRAEEAAVQFEKTVAMQPDFAEAHYHLGNLRLQAGRIDEAIAHFQKAAALQPSSVEAANDLGVALCQKGRFDDALPHFQKALELQPDFAEAHNNLGRIFQQKGASAQAVVHYRASLKLQPEDPDTLSNLGWVLATSGDASVRSGLEAMIFAQRAMQRTQGRDPFALRSLAAAYAECGRFSEAATTAQQAVQLAEQHGITGLASALRAELAVYGKGAPFRDAPPAPEKK
ncbi:MAG TPA: tetratricopeptide repeat protein [Opitutaceae bacterium]|nr:tetratricopeptide repeat protein [Opitutaceae bacterium]